MNKEASVIVALDVDRTLLDSTAFFEIICKISLQNGSNSLLIEQLINEEQASRGKQFDYISKLEAEQTLPQIQTVQPYMHDLLYEGAKELIDNLKKNQITYVLLTYGSLFAQTYKLRLIENALGYQLPFHVTNEPNKAAWLESIEHEGVFSIPDSTTFISHAASSVILIDDKLSNLTTSHKRIHTLLVDNDSHASSGSNSIPIGDVWDRIRSLLGSK